MSKNPMHDNCIGDAKFAELKNSMQFVYTSKLLLNNDKVF